MDVGKINQKILALDIEDLGGNSFLVATPSKPLPKINITSPNSRTCTCAWMNKSTTKSKDRVCVHLTAVTVFRQLDTYSSYTIAIVNTDFEREPDKVVIMDKFIKIGFYI